MPNHCSQKTSGIPRQEEHLKYLHDRLQEDELNIQQIKGLNEKIVKGLVAQAAINNFLLEDQLRVTPQKVVEIRSRLALHEVLVRVLEPMDFRTIAVDAAMWKQFVDGLARPT